MHAVALTGELPKAGSIVSESTMRLIQDLTYRCYMIKLAMEAFFLGLCQASHGPMCTFHGLVHMQNTFNAFLLLCKAFSCYWM